MANKEDSNSSNFLFEEALRLRHHLDNRLLELCNKLVWTELEVLVLIGELKYLEVFLLHLKETGQRETNQALSQKFLGLQVWMDGQRKQVEEEVFRKIETGEVKHYDFLPKIQLFDSLEDEEEEDEDQ